MKILISTVSFIYSTYMYMRIYPHLIKNYHGKSTIILHWPFNFFLIFLQSSCFQCFFKSLIQNTYCQYKHVIFQLTQLSKPNIDLNLNAQKKIQNKPTYSCLLAPTFLFCALRGQTCWYL